MNFFDLCVACARAIGRACAAVWHLFTRMLRLSYRYWWLVGTIVVLAIVAALYYTRQDNLTYRLNAVALLNGPSIQQFEQAYAPLRSGKLLPEEEAITPYLTDRKAQAFTTFRVIDCLNDGTADFIDFKDKSSAKDTVEVQMHDRLCLQFRMKARDMHALPEIERAMMDYLNKNTAMISSYKTYSENLQNEVAFHHSQAIKLDSLTSHYYFHNTPGKEPLSHVREGLVFMGDWRVHLFLNEIYDQLSLLQQTDYRAQLASAPVVLENHFSADPKPVNSRMKCLASFFLLGWFGACLLALLIDRRKQLLQWLKQTKD